MTTEPAPRYGGIEAGGTKFVCAVGSAPDNLVAETSFPTTTPEETLGRAVGFFREASSGGLDAVGIASFGPLDLDRASASYGRLTSTPKSGWSGVDLVGTFQEALGVAVALDTDVNGAALAEHLWGAATDADDLVYLTVGTGIGGGLITGGELVHGVTHPEMGHQLLPRRTDDSFEGSCPFHGACLEGLASGTAMAARWGRPAESLPDDHLAWDLESWYLATALLNLVYTVSPKRIVLGGGVMLREGLRDRVRQTLGDLAAGYGNVEALVDDRRYVSAPGLGGRAGVLGAIALARREVARTQR